MEKMKYCCVWGVKAEPSSTFLNRRLACRGQGSFIEAAQGLFGQRLTAIPQSSISDAVFIISSCLLACVVIASIVYKITTVICIPA